MNKLITLFLLFVSVLCFSQRETDNWYFGNKASLKFDKNKINITNNSLMNTPAGCSSISDSNGNLLFYSNGEKVWNKNHQIMINGEGLAGETTNTQSILIIPKPSDKKTYYIITTRKEISYELSLVQGVYYSEVTFSDKYPLGKISTKNKLLRYTASEKISAVHHFNGKDIWLITFGGENPLPEFPVNTFMCYKIDSNGINPTPIISKQKETFITEGSLKVSPNGKYIALADYDVAISLYNFNNKNAEILFNRKIITSFTFPNISRPYGIDFAQNSKILYFSCDIGHKSYIYQYIFEKEDGSFSNLKTRLFESSKYRFFSLQLASNGNIYISKAKINDQQLEYTNQLSEIRFPERMASKAVFIENSIDLDKSKSLKGLPNFIQSFFRNRIITKENQCLFDTFTFSLDSYAPINSVVWDFGDGNTSSDIAPEHAYTATGEYTVSAIININNQNIPLYKKITVYPLPNLTPNQEIIQCDNNNDGSSLFNLNNIANEISTDTTLTYKFYKNLSDAENNTNEILDPENFYNESNPQVIYTKATSVKGCFEIESFTIETLFKPSLNISPITTCEDTKNSVNSGYGFFDLNKKKDELINDFNLSTSDKLTFYPTYKDAQKSTNKLPKIFNSSTTTIWLKIENKNGCSGISPIDLIVNSPRINLKNNYTICVSPSDHPPVILTADSSNNRFEWKDENNSIVSTNSNFPLTRAGEFSLTVYKTVNGIECSNSKNFTVNYPPPPEILNVEVNVQSETDNSVYISIDGDSSYEFSLDGTTYVGNGTSHSFNNVQPGIATIYIRDINKCESPTKASASIIGYPKFLTPNADGFNDYWKVYGVSSNFFKEIDIKIFNRFGKVLYVINDNNSEFGWDGTYNNIKLPSNDYWFHAKLKDLNDNVIDKKGHFTLKRN
ncbi:T9SS type B sorting domain-containing protein [Tenacibaculum discolor]|uniref:T9SS type B sorting domain-containing protein n=1 Tax=Tenacibaculum discolor TaxID=361581 RepID=UPI000EB0E267|nr:T9SS type B sorting domain-containing protein [Tenacibaculum discolor]RLK00074.1 gliding motility-associated-like protein [Tenacibaculum discolor]